MTKKRKSKKSKSKGILASLILFVLLPLVVVIFGVLFLRAEIKILYKDIYQKEKEVEILQNQLEARLVEVQKLSAEERIIEIAKQKFGMVRIFSPVENIFVSELKIKQIQKIVDSKYD